MTYSTLHDFIHLHSSFVLCASTAPTFFEYMLISPQQIRQPEEEGVEQIKASVPLDLWGTGKGVGYNQKGVDCAPLSGSEGRASQMQGSNRVSFYKARLDSVD